MVVVEVGVMGGVAMVVLVIIVAIKMMVVVMGVTVAAGTNKWEGTFLLCRTLF
jgi:hypothetical protein